MATIAASLRTVRRLGELYMESLRLTTTEKVTVLLSSIASYPVAMAFGLVCLVFISIGLGHLLAATLAPHLAYLIIAAFYLLLFFLVIMLRRRIFTDPISRFMSRLLVEYPEEESIDDTDAPAFAQAHADDSLNGDACTVSDENPISEPSTPDDCPCNEDSH